MNFNKLKAKIIEKGITIRQLCKDCNISKDRFYRFFYNGSEKVTLKEMKIISIYLDLSIAEMMDIFFGFKVA